MADKLESITARLEKAISFMTHKLEAQISRLEQAVQRLESLQGLSPLPPVSVQKNVQSQVATAAPTQTQNQPTFTEFYPLYKEWEDKAKATNNQDIVELTNIAIHLFKWADSIIGLAGSAKKPSNEVITNLVKYFGTKVKEIDEKFLKPRKIENHAKAVKEGVGAALWVFNEAPAIYLDGVIEPTQYNGNKVKMQKNQAETEWIDKFYAVLKAFKDYAKAEHQIGLTWKGKTEGDFSQAIEGKLTTSAAPAASSSAAKEESKSSTSTPQQAQPQAAEAQEEFTAFNHLYKDWEEKAKATENQDLIELTNMALHVFKWTDAVIANSNTSKKPSADTLTNLNKYIGAKAKEIDDKYVRPRKLENQAKTVKEGIGAALWFLTEAPAIYIEGVIEPTQYSGNKVKMQKVAGEPEWIDKFIAILRGMKDYTKENYQTGLIWKGKSDADFSQLLEGKLTASPTKQAPAAAPSRAGLFADLNRGDAVTQGLKVADRKPKGQISTEPPLQPLAPTTSSVQKAQPKPAAPINKPPKTYLNNHWFIENYVNDRTIVMEEADMRQSVYVENCHGCLVQVKGKVKSIMISNCSKLDLVFESAVSSVEAVNTKGLNLQTKVHAPSIMLDKCERVKVYLAKNLETDIVSSKVTELNVSYLMDDDEFAKEFPVTEQFLTRWDKETKKFVTKPLDIFM